MQNYKMERQVKKQSWLGEGKGSKGPHWTLVPSNNNNNNNIIIYCSLVKFLTQMQQMRMEVNEIFYLDECGVTTNPGWLHLAKLGCNSW